MQKPDPRKLLHAEALVWLREALEEPGVKGILLHPRFVALYWWAEHHTLFAKQGYPVGARGTAALLVARDLLFDLTQAPKVDRIIKRAKQESYRFLSPLTGEHRCPKDVVDLENAIESFLQDNCCRPTDEELLDRLGWTVDQLLDAQRYRRERSAGVYFENSDDETDESDEYIDRLSSLRDDSPRSLSLPGNNKLLAGS